MIALCGPLLPPGMLMRHPQPYGGRPGVEARHGGRRCVRLGKGSRDAPGSPPRRSLIAPRCHIFHQALPCVALLPALPFPVTPPFDTRPSRRSARARRIPAPRCRRSRSATCSWWTRARWTAPAATRARRWRTSSCGGRAAAGGSSTCPGGRPGTRASAPCLRPTRRRPAAR
ncbi:MAG: hypothetical protein J3K34DRAFT_418206 [Monoraphidium minutum]|nr:MAG: hypothetical protein J3K34DRAFT_418206 [Monoraphidium minutum]